MLKEIGALEYLVVGYYKQSFVTDSDGNTTYGEFGDSYDLEKHRAVPESKNREGGLINDYRGEGKKIKNGKK